MRSDQLSGWINGDSDVIFLLFLSRLFGFSEVLIVRVVCLMVGSWVN